MAERMIWVENGQYNRAREAEREAMRRKREAEQRLRDAQERVRRARAQEAEAAAEERRAREQMQAEADRLMAGIDSMSQEMQEAIRNHAAQTQAQIRQLQGEILEVQDMAVELEGKIDDLAADVAERFRQLAEAADKERTRARLYSNQFGELLRQIRQLHPRELTPGVVEQELAPVTDFLTIDMANGDYQAAIGLAQTKIPEAAALLARLQVLNAQYRALQLEAGEKLGLLERRLAQLQDPECNRRPGGDSGYDFDGDITFWSSELLTVVAENLATTIARYRKAEQDMDLEQMEQTILQMAQLELQLTDCQELADQEFALFCMVQDLATGIYDQLTADEAWQLIGSGFAEEDPRRAFRMEFADGDGNVAAFVVIPNREVNPYGEPGEVQFMVDVCDGPALRNRERCDILRRGILARLRSAGIAIGAHNEIPGYGIRDRRETFVTEATGQGDRIKEDRLAAVRQQLQLT